MIRQRINLSEFHAIKARPLILDGAIGSLLSERNFPLDTNLWSSFANLTDLKAVKDIHKEYIAAGAEIITTNTFRTNPSVFSKSGLKISNKEFVEIGVSAAIEARGNHQIIVAGSNSPAEDCYQRERTLHYSELEFNHKNHIEFLWEAGCDIIWNETQSHLDEILLISKFCSENSLPFAMNLYFDEDLKILSGENLNAVVDLVLEYSPEVIGFNCIKQKSFEKYLNQFSLPERWGFYFNCGKNEIGNAKLECGIEGDEYAKGVIPLLKFDPIFAGSCCGSNPDHTKELKELFSEIY